MLWRRESLVEAMERIACYIDGFNLYHAIDDLNRDHLKWVDLWKLMENFVDPSLHKIVAIYYFSAFATWIPQAHKRHEKYVSALKAVGITTVMTNFKVKQRYCKECKKYFWGHEEKETDVNAAIYMLDGAYQNIYDRAYLVSRDSDLAPAVRLLRERFSQKHIRIISPPNRRHAKDLAKHATSLAKIKPIHLERCLLPEQVFDKDGHLVAERPAKYTPPK